MAAQLTLSVEVRTGPIECFLEWVAAAMEAGKIRGLLELPDVPLVRIEHEPKPDAKGVITMVVYPSDEFFFYVAAHRV